MEDKDEMILMYYVVMVNMHGGCEEKDCFGGDLWCVMVKCGYN